jgi:hypothetical protein
MDLMNEQYQEFCVYNLKGFQKRLTFECKDLSFWNLKIAHIIDTTSTIVN